MKEGEIIEVLHRLDAVHGLAGDDQLHGHPALHRNHQPFAQGRQSHRHHPIGATAVPSPPPASVRCARQRHQCRRRRRSRPAPAAPGRPSPPSGPARHHRTQHRARGRPIGMSRAAMPGGLPAIVDAPAIAVMLWGGALGCACRHRQCRRLDARQPGGRRVSTAGTLATGGKVDLTALVSPAPPTPVPSSRASVSR